MINSLRPLCALCVSAVNHNIPYAQLRIAIVWRVLALLAGAQKNCNEGGFKCYEGGEFGNERRARSGELFEQRFESSAMAAAHSQLRAVLQDGHTVSVKPVAQRFHEA
jgi:hypothetical protein